jgi:hypothetical protein
MLASMSMHRALSGGWWPRQDVAFKSPRSWVPEFPIRFDALVEHLSQQLLHRQATPRLLKACSQAVSIKPHDVITRSHPLVRWQMPNLLLTFLDSPAFLTR